MGEYKPHKNSVVFFPSFHLPQKYIEWFLYINAVKMLYIHWESFIAKLEQFRNIYLHVLCSFRVKSRRSRFYVYIILFIYWELRLELLVHVYLCFIYRKIKKIWKFNKRGLYTQICFLKLQNSIYFNFPPKVY